MLRCAKRIPAASARLWRYVVARIGLHSKSRSGTSSPRRWGNWMARRASERAGAGTTDLSTLLGQPKSTRISAVILETRPTTGRAGKRNSHRLNLALRVTLRTAQIVPLASSGTVTLSNSRVDNPVGGLRCAGHFSTAVPTELCVNPYQPLASHASLSAQEGRSLKWRPEPEPSVHLEVHEKPERTRRRTHEIPVPARCTLTRAAPGRRRDSLFIVGPLKWVDWRPWLA